MKPFLSAVLISLALLTRAGAAGENENVIDEFDVRRSSLTQDNIMERTITGPVIDPASIINESNAFLKEREPEMTVEEYALYEKVVTMLENNSKFALRLLEGMMNEKKEPSPAFEFILGNAYYSAGSIDRAEELYRSAVTRFPTFLRAWNNLGLLYYTSNRYAKAVPCFSKSVVLGDRDPMTFGLLGFCLEQGGDVVSAEMAYMQALAGDPGNSSWKEGLLRIYMQGRQFGRAEALVRSLIKERPTDTRFWLAYANIFVTDDRKLKAIALLETAVQAGIAGPDELNLLGDLYAEQHLVTEAIETYRKVMAPQPAIGERKLLYLARSLVTDRKYDEAHEALKSLQGELTAQGTVTALQIRGDLLAAQKKWPEARRELEAAIALAPMDGKTWISLGTTHVAEGDLSRATLAFETALKDSNTTYRAHLELANIELKNKHYGQSVDHLKKALLIQDSDEVSAYLTRIQTLVVERGETGP